MTVGYVYEVPVRGDFGLKIYYVAVDNGGLKGIVEAKEMGEECYKRELDKAKENVKAMDPKEVKLVNKGKQE